MDGWIEHDGSEMPVHPDTVVQVKLRDLEIVSGLTPSLASAYGPQGDDDDSEPEGYGVDWWVHHNDWYDIVAYRIVE